MQENKSGCFFRNTMYVNIAEHNAAFSEYLDNDIAVDVVFAVITVCFVYLGRLQTCIVLSVR